MLHLPDSRGQQEPSEIWRTLDLKMKGPRVHGEVQSQKVHVAVEYIFGP